jgi:hypothetical protein
MLVHSPLLKQSLLLAFPSPSDMLKFGELLPVDQVICPNLPKVQEEPDSAPDNVCPCPRGHKHLPACQPVWQLQPWSGSFHPGLTEWLHRLILLCNKWFLAGTCQQLLNNSLPLVNLSLALVMIWVSSSKFLHICQQASF